MAESTESTSLSSRLAGLNPFSKPTRRDNDDEVGEEVTSASVAGGGHAARQSQGAHTQLRVSHALRTFLVDKNVLSAEEAGLDEADRQTEAISALLEKPHIEVPSFLTERSHPLPEYFISSSHNTYLMAHQLFGDSSAGAYETVLNAGSRCVEIDAWDNEDDEEEPKVTHGFTLVSHISFRSVCEAIRDFFDREAEGSKNEQGFRSAPILLSLENHCNAHGQLRLVQIMKEVWSNRLLSEAMRQEGHEEQQGTGKHVCLEDLGSKIVVIVEHHIPNEIGDEDDSSSEDEDGEEKRAREAYNAKKKEVPTGSIISELARLGVYAQSVKPSDNSWYDQPALRNGPHHHLINVSESGLATHMPAANAKIGIHNAHHLMRVFPKGTRISSKNINPVPFWGVGAQICALNWQTFGAGMQLNEALFSGSDGFVLKPTALRSGGSGKLTTTRKKRLRFNIAGASDIPIPQGCNPEEIRPYVTCMLIHPDDVDQPPPKRKTFPYKHHKLGFLHKGENPRLTDPVWDEMLEWDYYENDMVFLRILIKSDDSFAANPVFAVAAVRLLYATTEWRFIRMLDLKGRETTCSLLVRFEIGDA